MKTATSYKDIDIPLKEVNLKGILRTSEDEKGLVIFSHGSGSSRLSQRNNFVAEFLQLEGYSSFLFDLLTEHEDLVYENRFNIPLLSQRLIEVTHWLLNQQNYKELPIGYFGASTGAASALGAAAELGAQIRAVVSRGGRPDLSLSVLDKVKAPTLLIVGGNDDVVIELNKKAYDRLACIKKIEIVPGATHLFSEPGKLETVAKIASEWFDTYLKGDDTMIRNLSI